MMQSQNNASVASPEPLLSRHTSDACPPTVSHSPSEMLDFEVDSEQNQAIAVHRSSQAVPRSLDIKLQIDLLMELT